MNSFAQAAPNVTRTINFQGRLLSSSGAVVPDGYYNMQFKIYEGGSGTQAGNPDGTLKWTEDYTNKSSNAGVRVRNGVFSVELGSINQFGSNINWDSATLWLSMNVAGNSPGCNNFGGTGCSADGEMLPMKKINATPYALNAGQLNGKTADNFVQVGGELQTGSTHLTGEIKSDSGLVAPAIDTAIAGELSIGAVNANQITLGSTNTKTTIAGSLSIATIDSLSGDGQPGPTEGPSAWQSAQSAGTRNWQSVTSSSDGAKIAAAVENGYIYTSTNYGTTWAERTGAGSRKWQSIASSVDGSKLVAVSGDGGGVYTSTDSGATWTHRSSAGNRDWSSVTSNSDGTKLVAAVWGGSIFTSTDSGATWTERSSAGTRSWYSISSSSDGTKLAAAVNNWGTGGSIYTSTDSGATWTERTSAGTRVWASITSNSDGTKLAAVDNAGSNWEGGYIYTSTDSGATWQPSATDANRRWQSIASSNDGDKLIAAGPENDYIYTSNDFGLNWTQSDTTGVTTWQAVASSGDGSILIAAPKSNYIHVYKPTQIDPPAPADTALSIGSTNATSINIGNSQSTTSIQGNLNASGSVSITSGTDSAKSLNVQRANGDQLLNVNASDNNIAIGQPDNAATLLVLDTKTTSGDPSGANGAMYYNSAVNKFRCYENGSWKDCITPLPVSKLASTDTTNSTTTPVDVGGLSFELAANTKYRYEFTIKYQGLGSNSQTGFGITAPSGSTNSNWCVNSTSLVDSAGTPEWGSYCGTADALSTHVVGGAGGAASHYTATMQGFIETGSNAGELKLRMVSGSTQTVEVSDGSFGILQIVQ